MKLNIQSNSPQTHEGGKATKGLSPLEQLRRTVLTSLLWEDTFYEDGVSVATRVTSLCPSVELSELYTLALEARGAMQLRHMPLLLVREMARHPQAREMRYRGLVEKALNTVIQRADEMGEFLAIYFKDNKDQPLTNPCKRGLAGAFGKFNEYQLAKYDRDGEWKLRDVLRLVHPKPTSPEQSALWKRVITRELAIPDTWEVALSAGGDKKEVFTRLLEQKKLGGLAVLRNLRNMLEAGVEYSLIKSRLEDGINRALPFRFLTAARYAPQLEDLLETAMFKGIEGIDGLEGHTILLVDVSGSMDMPLSVKGETTRLDAANGLAVLLREKAAQVSVFTFSDKVFAVPPRRGFGLRDAINNSQAHNGTYLKRAIQTISHINADRCIIITDEQSHDGCGLAFTPKAYVINVATYQNGVGYHQGWTHINGWSERVLDYIQTLEKQKDSES